MPPKEKSYMRTNRDGQLIADGKGRPQPLTGEYYWFPAPNPRSRQKWDQRKSMITDPETNVVYISDLLEPRYSELVESLRAILSDHGIPVKVIQGTREIWCRDFMPVQVGMGEFVQFHYKPDYLKGYEQWRTSPSDIEPLPESERVRHFGDRARRR